MPRFNTILSGPEHVFEFVNEVYSDLFGHREFVGRPARQVVPELDRRAFFEWLDQVYTTGRRYVAHHVRAQLQKDPNAPMSVFSTSSTSRSPTTTAG